MFQSETAEDTPSENSALRDTRTAVDYTKKHVTFDHETLSPIYTVLKQSLDALLCTSPTYYINLKPPLIGLH